MAIDFQAQLPAALGNGDAGRCRTIATRWGAGLCFSARSRLAVESGFHTPARPSATSPGGRVHAALQRAVSGDGHYVVGFISPRVVAPYDIDLFDARVLPWALTDKELERVHFNGVQEINRRGIPQWR